MKGHNTPYKNREFPLYHVIRFCVAKLLYHDFHRLSTNFMIFACLFGDFVIKSCLIHWRGDGRFMPMNTFLSKRKNTLVIEVFVPQQIKSVQCVNQKSLLVKNRKISRVFERSLAWQALCRSAEKSVLARFFGIFTTACYSAADCRRSSR